MSRRADRTGKAVGIAVAGALVVGTLLAWRSWDRPVGPGISGTSTTPAGACADVAPGAGAVRTESFALGGTVVRAETWCGVDEVVVEVQGNGEAGRLIVVAATTRNSITLGPPDTSRARLDVGPDGWVAIALAQADAQALADGGAWVTVTAGEPPR